MSFRFDDADKKNYLRMLSQCVKESILPNYFARYALIKDIKNPFSLPRDDITNDDIKDAISKLTGFWNKNKNNSKYTTILQQLLDESTKAKSTLLDPHKRAEYEIIVKEKYDMRRKEGYKLLDDILATKRCITTDELNFIYNEESRYLLSKEDIDRYLREKNIRVLVQLPPMLEPTIMQNIRNQLNVFKVNTLYEFLGVSQNDSIGKIQEAYFNLTNDWNKKPVSGEKTAAQGILGQVKTQLIEGGSQKYINGLHFEAMGKLDPLIKIAFLGGVLYEDVFASLVSKAKDEGIEEDFAQAYIFDKARQKGIPPCLEPKGLDPSTVLEKSELLRSSGQLKEALNSLIDAKELLGSNAELEKKISELKDEIKRLDAIYSSYKSALYDKKLYKAKEELRKLRALSPDYVVKGKTLDEMVSTLNAEIKKVEDGVQGAMALEHRGEYDEAYLTYENLLRLCRDCPDVIEGIRRIRPEPPQGVSISYKPGVVALNWKKSSSIGELTYHVIRKEGSKPTSVSDGILITKTEYLAVEDTNGEIGHNYYYSVFTERKGAFSLKGATTAGVLLYDDVKNFTLRPGDGVVEGSWDLPGTVKRVVVYKKEGATPSNKGDGEEIPVLGLTKFIDKRVQNGHRYYYKVFCEYIDYNGSKVPSKGVDAATTPNSPPPTLLNFAVTKEQSKAIIKWTPLERGSVYMYKSPNAPAYKEGTIIPKSDLMKLGTLLTSPRGDYAIDTLPEQGICYYTPVTIESDLGVIGRTQKLTFVDDVTALRAENRGSFIRLKWKWPAACTQAQVSWRRDRYPNNAEDTQAHKERISKAQYELKGCFQLDNPAKQEYFFKVYAGYRDNMEVLYSSGIGPEAGVKVGIQGGGIKYDIKKSAFRSKYHVVIRCDAFIEELPELVLVAKSGKVPPLNINDGVDLVRVGRKSIAPNEPHVAEVTASQLPRPCYLKAFFSDEASYHTYQIEHPSPREAYIK